MKAKPILDIQISVAALEPMTPYKSPLESIGFNWRQDNPDLTKWYFREASGERRFHIHVRKVGSWTEQFSLLFRDYMRMHPADAADYAGLKEQLNNSPCSIAITEKRTLTQKDRLSGV